MQKQNLLMQKAENLMWTVSDNYNSEKLLLLPYINSLWPNDAICDTELGVITWTNFD